MKKVMIIALILVGALLIPAVSADEFHKTFVESATYSDTTSFGGVADTAEAPFDHLVIKNAELIYGTELVSIMYQDRVSVPVAYGYNKYWIDTFPERSQTTRATLGDWATCDIGYFLYEVNGNPWYQYYMDNFEYIGDYPDGLTGNVKIPITVDDPNFHFLSQAPGSTTYSSSNTYSNTELGFFATIGTNTARPQRYSPAQTHYCAYKQTWKNDLSIITGSLDYVELTREYTQTYTSALEVTSIDTGDVYREDLGAYNVAVSLFPQYQRPYNISITNVVSGNIYTVSVAEDGSITYGDIDIPVMPPATATATVYVQNSQTGALIANAHINISASVNGTLHEVVNETAPSGIYSIDLQPTGGGMPNPDFYRLWVTLDGYNSQMPYIDFEVSGGTSVYVYMEPTTGGPDDENKTYIEFYVRDIYANPLANADVNCGGYTLKTNSAGYTQFELPKNAAYSYRVSKTGYLTIEGIATVESDDRYTVNVALMAGAVPTQTAVTPTITVEPTPTQTTPPIQEDNIIGLSVKGLAKGFGIDYDTALLLFGLMIIFGAGGIVMSSVKGGAMEFIAGSIVGTFVAFALGLIPIWIFIIIAIVFGAYVLRVFIQGGQ